MDGAKRTVILVEVGKRTLEHASHQFRTQIAIDGMGTLLEDAVDQRVVVVTGRKQGGYRLGRMLKIVVHRDNPLAASMRDAADGGRVLAEIPAKAQSTHARVLCGDRADHAPGFGLAAVVDQDHFMIESCRLHDLIESATKFGQGGAATIDRHHNGYVHGGVSIGPECGGLVHSVVVYVLLARVGETSPMSWHRSTA